MKKILAFGLTALVGASALLFLHSSRAVSDPAVSAVQSSSSQIYIHGTPVCVYKHDDSILAMVGRCTETPEAEGGNPAKKSPFSGNPGMVLPPGHPPVDRDAVPDGPRRLLI